MKEYTVWVRQTKVVQVQVIAETMAQAMDRASAGEGDYYDAAEVKITPYASWKETQRKGAKTLAPA